MPQIDYMRIEMREDGVYTLQNVFDEKIIERKVTRNDRVLYRDADHVQHFGCVLRSDEQQQQYVVQENVFYPNAPSLQAPEEIVPWSSVLAAAGGYACERSVVYDPTGRKMGGSRNIRMIWEGSDVGFIERQQASRLYVVCQNGRWTVRS
jgi:hypothetical protein